ncbi:MAG TPA: hypothetical protein VN030_06860 [Cellvibrio sp.]|nr:hypothetical protein [Cellvibrio sp.]
MNSLYRLTLVLALSIASQVVNAATLISNQDFESASLPTGEGWGFGAQGGGAVSIATEASLNHNGSKGSIKGSYPLATGGVYVWGGYNIAALKLSDVYIEFWAKMPKATQGIKFLKIFGVRGASDYANTTFALVSDAGIQGSITQVSFGDGTHTTNDTQNVINLDGAYPSWIGRSYGKASVLTPQKSRWPGSNWGTSWHRFKVHVKFNSGTTAANEVADGEYYLEIDNVVYVDAKGLFNRHYSNGPIEKISFFDWAQNGTSPFELWFDDIRISTGGFLSDNPMPPVDPRLTNE